MPIIKVFCSQIFTFFIFKISFLFFLRQPLRYSQSAVPIPDIQEDRQRIIFMGRELQNAQVFIFVFIFVFVFVFLLFLNLTAMVLITINTHSFTFLYHIVSYIARHHPPCSRILFSLLSSFVVCSLVTCYTQRLKDLGFDEQKVVQVFMRPQK